MIKLNVHEAKTHLSAYLTRMEAGERIILCRRNVPIAEIRPLSVSPAKPRQLGVGAGTARLSPGFFDPLPEELLKQFEGENG
jgi:antitoxin (DNA-binding transcriptional repressor) of toxin-antitoxin stability system